MCSAAADSPPGFQSTRPRGARLSSWKPTAADYKFQSTRPRGARRRPRRGARLDRHVSIHAPARGATRLRRTSNASYFVSIHAPARGATVGEYAGRGRERSFNPRAREGRDACISISSAMRSAFQSTRPRGARPFDEADALTAEEVSIHAPARGATKQSALAIILRCSFNPRAREGRDPLP